MKEIGHAAAVPTQTLPGEMSAIDARSQKPTVAMIEDREDSVVVRDAAVLVKVVDGAVISNQEVRCEVIVAVAIAIVHIRFTPCLFGLLL